MKFPRINTESHLMAKFRLQQFFIWSTNAVFLNLAIPFFEDKGLNKQLIPYALALGLVFSIFGRFLWGWIIDKTRSLKFTYMGLLAFTFAITCLTGFIRNEAGMFVMMAFLGICQHPLGSISESWVLRKFEGRESQYNFIRVFGSVGFTLFVILYGKLVETHGWNMIYIGGAFVFGILIAGAAFIGDIKKPDTTTETADTGADTGEPSSPAERNSPDLRLLFKNRSFVTACLVASIIFIANAPAVSYLFKIFEAKNGGVVFMSIGYAFSASGEIPFFLLYHRVFRNVNYIFRLFISVCLYIAAFTLIYLSANAWIAACGMALYGMAYSIFLPTMRFYIVRIAPVGLETSAQTVADAFYNSVAPILSTIFFGMMINAPTFGMMKSMLVAIGLHLLALAIIAIWLFFERRELKRP